MKIINYFKKLFRRSVKWNPSRPVKLVFTDRLGNKFYELKDSTQTPCLRGIAGQIAARHAEFCITKEYLIELQLRMCDHANKGDIVSLFSELTEMGQRIHSTAEEETLLQLAVTYYFIEGEDIEKPDPETDQRKIALWKKDPAALAFFLQTAFERTRQYSSMSETDIVSYLKDRNPNPPRVPNTSRGKSTTSSTK